MKSEKISIPVEDNAEVAGILSVPSGYQAGAGTGVIIAHGAGNDMNHPLLVHLSQGLTTAGYLTLRFNFLYREKGKKAPDRQDVLVKTWQSVHRYLRDQREYSPRTIVAAGKSMGGRVAAQMTAEGLLPVAGLVFLGYPLHPPGKKEKLKDEHFQNITVPLLFFAGTRDSLCDLGILKEVIGRLPAPCELEIIEGGDHSFRVPKSMATSEEEVHQRLLVKTLEWIESESLR
jgi:predicted alpha/beta-hydrolase family hydrolase